MHTNNNMMIKYYCQTSIHLTYKLFVNKCIMAIVVTLRLFIEQIKLYLSSQLLYFDLFTVIICDYKMFFKTELKIL